MGNPNFVFTSYEDLNAEKEGSPNPDFEETKDPLPIGPNLSE